jgi:hypothetical protein
VPEIAELDLNPVVALRAGAGCRVIDARIKVAMPMGHTRRNLAEIRETTASPLLRDAIAMRTLV